MSLECEPFLLFLPWGAWLALDGVRSQRLVGESSEGGGRQVAAWRVTSLYLPSHNTCPPSLPPSSPLSSVKSMTAWGNFCIRWWVGYFQIFEFMISFFRSQALRNRGSWLLGGQNMSGREVAILLCWTLPHLCAFSELQSGDVFPLPHWNRVLQNKRTVEWSSSGIFPSQWGPSLSSCTSPVKWDEAFFLQPLWAQWDSACWFLSLSGSCPGHPSTSRFDLHLPSRVMQSAWVSSLLQDTSSPSEMRTHQKVKHGLVTPCFLIVYSSLFSCLFVILSPGFGTVEGSPAMLWQTFTF